MRAKRASRCSAKTSEGMCRRPSRSSSTTLYIRRPSGAQRATRSVSRLVVRRKTVLRVQEPHPFDRSIREPLDHGIWRPILGRLRSGGRRPLPLLFEASFMAHNVSARYDVPGASRPDGGSCERSEPAAVRPKRAKACAGDLRAHAQPHCISAGRAARNARREACLVLLCAVNDASCSTTTSLRPLNTRAARSRNMAAYF
jgi:hypothetical protein